VALATLSSAKISVSVQTLVIDIDGFVIKNAKIEEAILALLNKPRVIRTQKPQNE
jgi:hypothetical protein